MSGIFTCTKTNLLLNSGQITCTNVQIQVTKTIVRFNFQSGIESKRILETHWAKMAQILEWNTITEAYAKPLSSKITDREKYIIEKTYSANPKYE